MRLRDHETLDPRVERELAAIDAALAGEAVGPDLADLAELSAALEELRAIPSEEFAAELDARAAAGFPGRERRLDGATLWERFRAVPLSRRLVPAGAVALAAVVAATGVVATNDAGDDGGFDSGRGGGAVALTEPEGAATGGAPPAEGGADRGGSYLALEGGARAPALELRRGPDTGPFASGENRRFVERSAQLTLGTEPERVQSVADDIFGVVGRYEGIVLSSSVQDGPEGQAGAQFSLLVPSASLSGALSDLSRIAEVRSRQESTVDITAPVVTVRERLRDARAEVEGLLKQLAQADSDEERAAVKAQLRFQRQRTAALRAAKNSLERRANFSRVALDVVTGDALTFGSEDDGAWSIGDAVNDAGRILGIAAGVTLVGLAVIAPFALLIGLALLGRRAWVRQGRERALEG